MAASHTPRYLTTEEVAERFRTSPGTVRYWRHVRKGPASFRVGARVLYAVALVEAWEAEQQAVQYAAVAPHCVADGALRTPGRTLGPGTPGRG